MHSPLSSGTWGVHVPSCLSYFSMAGACRCGVRVVVVVGVECGLI